MRKKRVLKLQQNRNKLTQTRRTKQNKKKREICLFKRI